MRVANARHAPCNDGGLPTRSQKRLPLTLQTRNYAEMNLETNLPDTQNHLPAVLRDSKVPWKPVCDGQAATPGPEDSWTCFVGPIRFDLDAFDFSWTSNNPVPDGLTYVLRLFYVPLDREISSWTYTSLPNASEDASEHYAELSHCMPTCSV